MKRNRDRRRGVARLAVAAACLALLLALSCGYQRPYVREADSIGYRIDEAAARAPEPGPLAALNVAPTHFSASAVLVKIYIGLLFAAMLTIPYVPSVVELYRPLDDKPLFINLEYRRNPRYFSKSFRDKILKMQSRRTDGQDGLAAGKLSREESVEYADCLDVGEREKVAELVCLSGDLTMGEEAALENDAFVRGSARLGPHCRLRAMAVNGMAELGPGVVVERWLDAEKRLLIGDGCDLGVICSSGGLIELGKDVSFHRLYGAQIRTAGANGPRPSFKRPAASAHGNGDRLLRTIADELDYYGSDHTVLADGRVEQSIVVRGHLHAMENAILLGSVRVHGNARFGRNVTVVGNVFCDGSALFAENCTVLGNVFSQKEIRAGAGCTFGSAGGVKSVIAKKNVLLGPAVVIYGYVACEGRGRAQ